MLCRIVHFIFTGVQRSLTSAAYGLPIALVAWLPAYLVLFGRLSGIRGFFESYGLAPSSLGRCAPFFHMLLRLSIRNRSRYLVYLSLFGCVGFSALPRSPA